MIRRVGPDEWADWRLVRQRSLIEDPQAFASSVSMWTGEQDTEERWRARLASDGACFLAYEDGAAVGMVAARPVEADEVELISMWVAPEARGAGLGRALVDSVIGWAWGRRLRLRVMDGNGDAVSLYAACGFVLDDVAPDHEGCRVMRRPAD